MNDALREIRKLRFNEHYKRTEKVMNAVTEEIGTRKPGA
jgi:hypothetical protein